ncbi:30S ribosomal protein S17 [Candidatus Woesearchaeota archaeon]|nr:30S ribosomal protein S17 [Candidatus Woesearchaeota archaeon]
MAEAKNCTDQHCPHHGSVKTHGRAFVGTVIEAKMQKTATIEWPRTRYLPKYERTATERSRVKAHNPGCIDAKKGDIVRIQECRPLSKTKTFTITEVLGQNRTFLAREELLEEAKMPEKVDQVKSEEA